MPQARVRAKWHSRRRARARAAYAVYAAYAAYAACACHAMATGDGDVPDGVGVGVMAGTDVLGEVHPRTRVAARATVGEDVPIGEGAGGDERARARARAPERWQSWH